MFLLPTTIVARWLMYPNRLSFRTSLIALPVSRENLDWGAAEPEELARAFSLLVNSRRRARTRYSIVVCVTPIFGLFPGNCRLAT